ncbi:hypothetical protein LguiA_013672 [Lonicera macranthoides]
MCGLDSTLLGHIDMVFSLQLGLNKCNLASILCSTFFPSNGLDCAFFLSPNSLN